MNYKRLKTIFFIISIFCIPFFAGNTKAANVGDSINFNIDKDFDLSARSQVQGVLVKTTPNLYFYVEKNWWDSKDLFKQNEILINLDNFSSEFNNRIYPKLTSVFGSEWNPGVDGDSKITIFFHLMKEGVGGYFRSADGYVKLQLPNSNEREMLYISTNQIDSPQLKIAVAHEFVHLITFNQKDRLQNTQEEVWLNEARADFASTIMGYDSDFYEGSNLQRRVKDFLNSPSDSLTEWRETKYDYASVSLFMQYLVDHYGISVLSDSIKSKSVGIASINEVLLKQEAKENFAQAFTNWTIATVINNCSQDTKYCYLNSNLKNLKINPTLNFLPLSGDSSLSVTNITKNWSGGWQKIIGGNGNLKLEFSSLAGLNFQVPYIIFDKDNNYFVKSLQLDKNQKGQININNFGDQYKSLIVIPSLQTKITGFNGLEPTYPYTINFTISIINSVPEEDQVLIQKLLAQIDDLKKQIAEIQGRNNQNNINLCSQININLYVGILNSNEVKCLQQFLKNQGQEIYPEALVTGYFGNLTRQAVIRFQEKYKSEILSPLGIINGTGFVGVLTRTKINQLLQ